MDRDAGGVCELGLPLVVGVERAVVGSGGGDDQEVGRPGGAALRPCDRENLAVALGDGLVDRQGREGNPDGVEAGATGGPSRSLRASSTPAWSSPSVITEIAAAAGSSPEAVGSGAMSRR